MATAAASDGDRNRAHVALNLRAAERRRLVEALVDAGHVRDPRLVDALLEVPREAYLGPELSSLAYADQPMPIGAGQTISAPHMVAIMCQRLRLEPGMNVLEIGTGSGYHAAVVAHMVGPAGRVTSVEFFPELAQRAKASLAAAGVKNVEVRTGDGARGAPDLAPFDRIYLACAAPEVPPPLLEQLKPDGIFMAPVGETSTRLIRMRQTREGWSREDLGGVAFVPLRGEFGLD